MRFIGCTARRRSGRLRGVAFEVPTDYIRTMTVMAERIKSWNEERPQSNILDIPKGRLLECRFPITAPLLMLFQMSSCDFSAFNNICSKPGGAAGKLSKNGVPVLPIVLLDSDPNLTAVPFVGENSGQEFTSLTITVWYKRWNFVHNIVRMIVLMVGVVVVMMVWPPAVNEKCGAPML